MGNIGQVFHQVECVSRAHTKVNTNEFISYVTSLRNCFSMRVSISEPFHEIAKFLDSE